MSYSQYRQNFCSANYDLRPLENFEELVDSRQQLRAIPCLIRAANIIKKAATCNYKHKTSFF